MTTQTKTKRKYIYLPDTSKAIYWQTEDIYVTRYGKFKLLPDFSIVKVNDGHTTK